MEVLSNSGFKSTTRDGGRVSLSPPSAYSYSEKLVRSLDAGWGRRYPLYLLSSLTKPIKSKING